MNDQNHAPLFETAAKIMQDAVKFKTTLATAEREGANYANLEYLVGMHRVNAAYFQAAGLFAIAASIQALHNTIAAEIAAASAENRD